MNTSPRDAIPLRLMRYGLFAVLLISPLPFGSVQPSSLLSLQLAAAVLGTVAVLTWIEAPDALSSHGRRVLALVLVVVGIGVLQLVPLPEPVTRLITPPTALARSGVAPLVQGTPAGFAPLSLAPAQTVDALARLLAYLALGLTAALALGNRRDARSLALVLTLSGGFQGLYGSAEYLSGHQHIFGFAKVYFSDEASGTFINRNHYAGYLAITLPFALSLAIYAAQRLARATSWRQRLLQLARPDGLLLVFATVMSGLIWTGGLLSYSRTGLVAMLVGVVFLFWRLETGRPRRWLLAAALAVPTLLLLGVDVRAPGERLFGETLIHYGGRLPVWGASLEMVPSYFFLGSGFGTFESLFALYRPASIHALWNHAHNDWLQVLTEGGILVWLAAIGILILTLRRGRKTGRFSKTEDVWSAAISAAIVAIAVHSLADFCVRIPAVGALVASLIGAGCARRTTRSPSP